MAATALQAYHVASIGFVNQRWPLLFRVLLPTDYREPLTHEHDQQDNCRSSRLATRSTSTATPRTKI
eukprot:1459388-Pyramimonas_sp.AAC.1